MNRKLLIYTLFLLVLHLTSFVSAHAGTDLPVIKVLDGNSQQIKKDSFSVVEDSKFFDPAYATKLIKPYKVQNRVSLKINEAAHFFFQGAFTATVQLRVYATRANLSIDSVDKTLSINYNATATYLNHASYNFNGAYRVMVKVLSVTSNVAWDVWKSIHVVNELQSFPAFQFSCTDDAVQQVNHTNLPSTTQADELPVSWEFKIAADEYDLEWTYIDSSALAAQVYGNPSAPDVEAIFKNNGSRVTVAATAYAIPLLYDGSGTLFYRVRSVQRKAAGGRTESVWSSTYSGGIGRFEFKGHSRNLNWQATTTFAEDGKRKTVVQYFDGNLYGRQTVTKDNTTQTTIVAESIYDYQGRPVIQVLPAPTLNTIIQYTKDFNVGLNGSAYDKEQFDILTNAADYCAPLATPMDTSSGASRYYSPANPLKSSSMHAYVPDAKGYPFTQIEYTPDHTGRISRQSGVGPQFRLGSGQETRYYYGTPDQRELDALFGTEAGHYSHYFKTMVRDANGQYSVSYQDMLGRTIATALAGTPPDSIKLDLLPSHNTRTLTESLVDPQTTVIKDLVMENKKSLLVAKSGLHQFNYQLNPQSLQMLNCDSLPVCYDCLYDLQITISDDCNNQKLGGERFDTTIRNFSLAAIDTLCSNPAQGFSFSFSKYLPEGNYEITKKLSVSRFGMEYYRDSIYAKQSECKTVEEFIQEQKAIIAAAADCKPSCQSCLSSVGDWETFRNQFLTNAGITTDTATYRGIARQAWEEAKAACDELCANTSELNDIRKVMLLDLTPPSGQYANLDSAAKIYSIFHIAYNASDEPIGLANYKKPTNYLDADGQPDLVYDEKLGMKVPPQDLSPEAFVKNFKLSWANALLPYHPEYCKLTQYQQLESSHLWDKRFEATETFKAALEKGYLNPTGNNTSPFSRYNGQPVLVDPDPLSGVYSNASNQFKTKLETQLREYKDNNFINASGISMWGLATITAVCANDNSLNCFTTNGADNKAFDTLTMCTGDLDMAWRTFRQLYLDIKREIVYAHINAACAGQPGNVTAATLVNARHQVHFSDAKELLQLQGMNLPTTQAQANALQQQTQVDNAAYYVSNCQAYASQWWRQMKPCNYNSADSAVIMPRLIQVCIEGSDIAHPLGSSTVKPGSTYPFKSFYDVFMHYADSAKKVFNTAACNVYLINAPAPYDKPAMNTNLEVWSKPDSCLCNRFNQLYTKYQQQPSGFTSFSAYIAGKFGVTMPEADLQTILQLCNGTSTCNYLPKPIKIPVALQCGNELACIDCDQMAQTYAQFLKDFPNAHRTSNNTTAVQTYYTLFTNYFNAKFGFNKSYQDYMQFLQTCNIFTYQPSTTTTNLQGVALGTGTGHTDASQVSSDTLQAVATQFNTLYPNVGPWNLVTKKEKRILYPTLEYLLGCAGISGLGTPQRTVNPPEWKGSGLKDNAYASGWFRNNLTFVNFNVREIPSTAIVDSVNLKMSPVLTAPFNPGIYWADITTAWDTSLTCGQLASSYYGTQVATYTPMYQYTSPQGNLVYTYNCLNQYTGYFKFPWFYLGNGLHSILNPATANSNDQTFIGTNNPIAQSDAEAKPRLEVWLRSDTLYSCKDFIVTYFNDRLKTNLTYDQLVQVYQQTTGTALPINCGTSPANAQLCGRTEPLFPEIETDEIDNCGDSTFFAVSKGTELYLEYKKRVNDAFDSSYRAKCMQAYQFETFTVTHDVSEYHYTLYYYDQAGNLVKTVPPEGVQPNFNLLWLDSVKVARSNGTVKVPDHGLLTQYRYNTLNAVTVQHTPDAGRSNFWYDRLARLAVSQNAKQKAASTGELNSKYSYMLYDVLGRITEAGQIANAGTVPITDSITRRENLLATWISNSAAKKEQITQTVYDTEYAAFTGLANAPLVQRNLRNRVAYTTITVGNNPAQYNQASFYTYDVHGNVDTLVQDYGSSAFTAVVNVMNANGNRFKKMVYQYDLISGKVNHVAYQPRQADQFYHRYAYDADNRLVLAETSADSLNWERDARYQYYKHGPLARTILGEQQVQGLDYAYTLKGWLKGLNSSALNADFDMGNDGKTGTQNQYIGRDAVGFNLNYFTGDYAAISNANVFGGTSGFLGTAYRPLYNGNISSMAVNIRQFNNPLLYNYIYDQLNRLKAMDAYNGLNQSTNSWSGLTLLQDYRERVTYDANGNILTYTRNATGAANTIAMDNLTYNYNRNGGRLLNNRLNFIGDAIAANRYTVDIDNQSTGNYVYDEIGNLTKDNAEKITNIIWNVYGKIQEIQKTATTANPVTNIQFTYDAAGNRISKRVAKSGTTTIEFTWYVRDVQGNVMATYNSTGTGTTMSAYSLQARELHLYGSSRIGVLNKTINMKVTPVLSDTMNHYRGLRHYELSNHLGNVLATISDKKIGVSGNSTTIDYYNADIVTAQDYYPFGMMMPGRNYNASGVSDYRFGFNGKENDNEVKGEGSQQDYGMRIYDPRIGKFLSVDPIASKYPELTPYQFASNSPIASIDLDGLEGLVATGMPQPFSNNSRPVGMIFTAEEAAKINRNATIAAFKGVFSDPLPKKFIDHYANSNGADYKLTRSEAFSLNVEKTGIKGIAQADVDRFNEMTSSIRTRVRRGNKTIESKYTILYLDSYNIQGAANVGGTLGRFTIQLQGKLTINSSDKTWTFEGKMRYFDTYDFKTSPVGENDLHRSSWGDFQTGFAGKFLPGTGFNVYSDWFDVKQSSSDLYFDFFKGKSSESKQNRVSNEIQTSTENGSDNAVPKEIKEGKGG